MPVILSKQIVMPVRTYTWEKYDVVETVTEYQRVSNSRIVEAILSEYSDYVRAPQASSSLSSYAHNYEEKISSSNTAKVSKSAGTYTISCDVNFDVWSDSEDDYVLEEDTDSMNIKIEETAEFTFTSEYTYTSNSSTDDWHYIKAYITCNKPVYKKLDTPIITYSKGPTLQGTVESQNLDRYPDNGYQDGYWYVRV